VPLSSLYEGPFEVIERSPKYYVVKLGEKLDRVSVDRLKPYLGADSPVPAQPPVRG